MSTNSRAGFIFLLSRLLSLWRHWALVAAVLLCILQKRSLAEQSNPVQGKTVVLPLNHSVVFLLFCVCYITWLRKIICLCHSGLAGRRWKWLQFLLSCTERATLGSCSSSLLWQRANDKLFFLSPWGSTSPVLLNRSLFTLKELLEICVNHNYITVYSEELMFRS